MANTDRFDNLCLCLHPGAPLTSPIIRFHSVLEVSSLNVLLVVSCFYVCDSV